MLSTRRDVRAAVRLVMASPTEYPRSIRFFAERLTGLYLQRKIALTCISDEWAAYRVWTRRFRPTRSRKRDRFSAEIENTAVVRRGLSRWVRGNMDVFMHALRSSLRGTPRLVHQVESDFRSAWRMFHAGSDQLELVQKYSTDRLINPFETGNRHLKYPECLWMPDSNVAVDILAFRLTRPSPR